MATENTVYLQKENKEYDENGKVIFIERQFSDKSFNKVFFKYFADDNRKDEIIVTHKYDAQQRKIGEKLVVKPSNSESSMISDLSIDYSYQEREKSFMLDEIKSVKITCNSKYGHCITNIRYADEFIHQEVFIDNELINQETITWVDESHRVIHSPLMGYFDEKIKDTSKGIEVIVTAQDNFDFEEV